MGLPELKSRFGLGRRAKEPEKTVKEPERRLRKTPAEPAVSTTGVRSGVPVLHADRQQRDPAALRAYTTPNICVQAGRIEFIQNATLEKRELANTLPSQCQSTLTTDREETSHGMSPASSVAKIRADVTPRSLRRREVSMQGSQQSQVGSPMSSVARIPRDVTLLSREKRDAMTVDRPRDASSLRHAGVTVQQRCGVTPVTMESVTRSGLSPRRHERSVTLSAEISAVKGDRDGDDRLTRENLNNVSSSSRMSREDRSISGDRTNRNTTCEDRSRRGDQGSYSGENDNKRISTIVPKEKKEEDNQERRNIHSRPPVSVSPGRDLRTSASLSPVRERASPLRSPTPVRRLSKVRAKVAQFEQLGGAAKDLKEMALVPAPAAPPPPAAVQPAVPSPPVLPPPPASTPVTGDITSTQNHLEEELNNLERGLEEECLNFRKWNRLVQRSAGEGRFRQNRQLISMSVENDRCRDRIFSMQDELQRSEDRARAAELARSEADKKLTAMDSLMKAHETERQHWVSQIHQLTLQLERLKTAPLSEDDAATRAELEVKVRSLESERQQRERVADRCLDELANQIVQALSKQKTMQSGLARLRRRIHELEHENAVLYSLLGRDASAPRPLPSPPPPPQAGSGSPDEEEMTAVCAKVRRLLEEHYSCSSAGGHRAAPASTSPLRWSQFAALLAADSNSAFTEESCPLCVSPPCDTDSQPHLRGLRTSAPVADAVGSCSSSERRQTGGSDVMQRLCEVVDSANTAQRRLASLGGTQNCNVVQRTNVTTALTDAEKCATLAALPVKLSELSRITAELVNPKRSPELATRASSCPPSRDESKREEGRDEGYSTMSSDVQANVSADSGVSVNGAASEQTASENKPRLEEVTEVQEECPAAPATLERPASTSSSDSEDLRSLVQALRQSLRPGRRLRASADCASNMFHRDSSSAHARYSCVLPSRPRRPVHRCRSDSRLCVKRWSETSASSVRRRWDAPERSTSTLELGAASTFDTRRSASLKRAVAEESLERPPSPHAPPAAFVPAALPWRDDSSELWRNCFSLESAGDMEDWSLSAEELRSEMTDEGGGTLEGNRATQADSSDYSRVGSFSNIQESILELEEDASECLWNNASYMTNEGRPAVLPHASWPYELPQKTPTPVDYHPLAVLSPTCEEAPRCSWSSSEQLNFADIAVLDFNDDSLKKGIESESLPRQYDMKRFSNGSDAMSCVSVASEDGGDNNLETDFKRDFYRLVKYESSKSLALSETSVKGDDDVEPVSTAERELALSSMLDFISEQQRYIEQRESQDQGYIDQRQSPELPDVATAPAIVTDSSCSDTLSTVALERSSSSTASVLPADHIPSSLVEPSGRGALDSSIQLAQLTRRVESKSASPSRIVTSPKVRSPTAPAVHSPVIVYRAEISTNHKAYSPSNEELKHDESPAKLKSKGHGECTKGTACTSNAKQSSKSGIPRSPLVGKRKRTAAVAAIGNQNSQTPRGRPPGSPKLTSKLKRDSVRPVPEPPVVAKASLPSPKLLRRLTPSRADKASTVSDPTPKRSESSPATPQRRAESPLRRSSITTSSSSTSSTGGGASRSAPVGRPASSRIPRLRGSRSTDSRVDVGNGSAGGGGGGRTELVRTLSEPTEISSGTSPLIVRHGDVTSFHRRATSRQLIDELRRLSALEAREEESREEARLEKGQRREREESADGVGCDTGWIRVDQHIGHSQGDSHMYDVMLAAPSDSSSDDDVIPQPANEYQHLKWVHQARRRKLVSRRKDGAVRYTPVFRPPIHNRPEFFFRYGPQEQAALATFDFLDALPSSSSTSDVTVSSPMTSRKS